MEDYSLIVAKSIISVEAILFEFIESSIFVLESLFNLILFILFFLRKEEISNGSA